MSAGWRQRAIRDNSGGSDQYTRPRVRLMHPALAGNCLVLAIGYTAATGDPTATVPTITDNIGTNVWDGTSVPGKIDPSGTGNGYALRIFLCPNVAAGTKTITVTFSAATIAFQAFIGEAYGIATASPVDGGAGVGHNEALPRGVTAGNPWQSGSITTVTDGDLIVQIATNDALGGGTLAPDTGFTLEAVSRAANWGVQSAIQTTHGAINPALTSSIGADVISTTFALKVTGAGSPPDLTKANIAGLVHQAVGDGSSTSFAIQIPTRGKLILVSYVGDGAAAFPHITGVTDSAGNTYVVKTQTGSLAAGGTQYAYVLSPTNSNALVVTVTFNSADNLSNVFIYDVEGPGLLFDQLQSFSGNDLVGGNLTIGSLTPSLPGGFLHAAVSVADGHLTEMTGSWTAHQDDNPDSTGSSQIDEDNGWGHIVPTAATSQSAAWGDSLTDAGQWAGQMISFVPPVSAIQLTEDGYLPSAPAAPGPFVTTY